jgi:hypothetical protein
MKRFILPAAFLFCLSSCASDGGDGNDANDTTENALQHVGDRIEDGFKEAVDSGVPKLGRTVDRADELLERADTTIEKIGSKVERVGDRIGRRFDEGRDSRDTAR